MPDTRNIGQEVQAEILKTVRRSQEAVTGTIRTWVGTVRTITPALPDLNLPFASKLPKPEELAGNAYALAEKLLASQRKFAMDVLHATAPLLPGRSETTAKHNGTTTPHESARKTGTTRKTGTSRPAGTTRKTGTTE